MVKKNKCTCGCDSVGSNYHSNWCDSLLPYVEETWDIKIDGGFPKWKLTDAEWYDMFKNLGAGDVGIDYAHFYPNTATGAKDLLRGTDSFKLIPPSGIAYPPDAYPDTDDEQSENKDD